jgi:hypothetical protein
VILLLLTETTTKIKLLGLWQNGVHPLLVFFGYSLTCIFLTLLPSDQFFNQLKIHDYNPINRISMICYGNYHSRFIIKILHLILLVFN